MAIHNTSASMVKESLREMLEVSIYCVEYRKKPEDWGGYSGCYGYPAAILLLSIVDSIGSYVIGGGDDVSKHFTILNHKDYYDLNLTAQQLKEIEKDYRNLLNHNSVLAGNVVLAIGSTHYPVYKDKTLYLLPFLDRTKLAVKKFIEDADNLVQNKFK